MYRSEVKDVGFIMDMVQTPLFETVDDLRGGDVIVLNEDDLAPAALRTLCDNNILAAPVVNALGKYTGMMDMMTLVSYSLDMFDQSWRPFRDDPNYVSKKGKFRRTTVRGILDRLAFGLKTSLTVHEEFSLYHAFEKLCLSDSHRMAVVNSGGVVTGLVTHSMLVKWLHGHISTLPTGIRDAKTGEIRPWSVVPSIRDSSKAIVAFRMMKNEGCEAVAVVDNTGRLVDVISPRDLRGLSPGSLTFRFLWNSATYFKDQVREKYPQAPVRPVVVTRSATLAEMLKLMVDEGVHRVFVVDDPVSKRPVDIISMRDCLRFVFNFTEVE